MPVWLDKDQISSMLWETIATFPDKPALDQHHGAWLHACHRQPSHWPAYFIAITHSTAPFSWDVPPLPSRLWNMSQCGALPIPSAMLSLKKKAAAIFILLNPYIFKFHQKNLLEWDELLTLKNMRQLNLVQKLLSLVLNCIHYIVCYFYATLICIFYFCN